ncbi:FMN-binding protein [Actinoplanes sp. DH11]|uniref:FMN-binding protein n=1 Tax=Actinoplanes sp. DH11 TaxID=2857011 RepID=UPI001E3C1EE0|nr:FMN-binding protein [Actinoplanes sp. DH11]
MRRISLWLLSTVAAVVLLFSYRTSTGAALTGAETVAVATAPATEPGTEPTTAASPATETETYAGDTVRTREGDVQVVITVTGGRITAVSVPVYPSGSPRHDEVSARALPILVQATLDAQSAGIDAVSGATFTSGGYRESLQSALDAARLS